MMRGHAFVRFNLQAFYANSPTQNCVQCPTLSSSPFHLLVDNTAGIVTKRSGFRRRLQEIYLLPVVIEDNGYPPKSSTGTLTIRVCGCESDGSLLTCGAEAIFLPVGLSTGALIAILLCIIILLGETRSGFKKALTIISSNRSYLARSETRPTLALCRTFLKI